MITALVIFGIVVLSFGCFWAYRQYLIANMTDEEIRIKLRQSRRVYNRLSYDDRNSRFGKNLYKSIKYLQSRSEKIIANA